MCNKRKSKKVSFAAPSYALKYSTNIIVSLIKEKISFNTLLKAFVLISNKEIKKPFLYLNGLDIYFIKNEDSIVFEKIIGEEIISDTDELNMNARFHFLTQIIDRRFDLSILMSIYHYVLGCDFYKNVELTIGHTTIVFEIVGKKINLVTGWKGER